MGLLALLRLRGLLGLRRGVVLGLRRRMIFRHRRWVVLRRRSRPVLRDRAGLVVRYGRARWGLRFGGWAVFRNGASLGGCVGLDGLRRLIGLGRVGLVFGPVLRVDLVLGLTDVWLLRLGVRLAGVAGLVGAEDLGRRLRVAPGVGLLVLTGLGLILAGLNLMPIGLGLILAGLRLQ